MNGILKEAERKLLRLLLKETVIYINTEIEFNEAIQNTFLERYVQEKELVQRRKLKVRKSLEERRRKKYVKFLCRGQSLKRGKKKHPSYQTLLRNL